MRRGHKTVVVALLWTATLLGMWLYSDTLYVPKPHLYTSVEHELGQDNQSSSDYRCPNCVNTGINYTLKKETESHGAVSIKDITKQRMISRVLALQTRSTMTFNISEHVTTSLTSQMDVTTAANQNKEDKSKFTASIMMVVSYMRSGSTFTADILQHFPNTLYVFEPLHRVVWRVLNGEPLSYLNGTVRKTTKNMLTDDFLKDELHKWLQCRFDELDAHTLFDDFHKVFSRSMRRLPACWIPLGPKMSSLRKCLPQIIDFCKKAKRRLFKFIRLPMRVVEDVFSMYPNMKVVHLLRDPRGTVTSQQRFRKKEDTIVHDLSKNHCAKVENDLSVTTSLYNKFPTRIKILVYEELASSPISVARRLYRFADVTPFKYILNYISRVTFSKRNVKCTFCIIRQNSTETAFKWQQDITQFEMEIIDQNCRQVYEHIGFHSYSNVTDLQPYNTFTPYNVSIFL